MCLKTLSVAQVRLPAVSMYDEVVESFVIFAKVVMYHHSLQQVASLLIEFGPSRKKTRSSSTHNGWQAIET